MSMNKLHARKTSQNLERRKYSITVSFTAKVRQ